MDPETTLWTILTQLWLESSPAHWGTLQKACLSMLPSGEMQTSIIATEPEAAFWVTSSHSQLRSSADSLYLGTCPRTCLKPSRDTKGITPIWASVNSLLCVDPEVNSCSSINPTDADARGSPVYTGSRQDSSHLSNRLINCELHCRPSTVTWPSSNLAQLWSLR